jgi:hypothetical protein
MKNLLAIFVLVLAAAVLVPFSTAKSAQATATVAGKWHFVLDTPGGDRELDAEFKQDGDQVSGKWAGTDGVKGTFSDGKLNLEFPFNSDEGGAGTMKIKGTLTGDAISGDWGFSDYSGAFKATRVKE